MVSICIPSYGDECLALVSSLRAQLTGSSHERSEILVHDDGGPREVAQVVGSALAEIPQVRYLHREESIGRAANRNGLAQAAVNDRLLFCDADAATLDKLHVDRMLKALLSSPVVVGGTAYAKTRPADPNLLLRYRYGVNREQLSARERAANPHVGLSSFNFAIQRHAFDAVGGFDERLRQYGHEDTVFGYALSARGFEIKHIDSALRHDGLTTNEDFLDATQAAVRNLHRVREWYPELVTGLSSAAERYKSLLAPLKPLAPRLRARLIYRAELRVFDLWRALEYLRAEHTLVA